MGRPGSGLNIVIVGAGLAGSLLAVYLARAGHRVRVFERRPDPRAAGYIGGRSINLALSARGIWGMEGVGLAGEMLEHAIAMRGRMLHGPDGKLAFQPYSKDPGDAINSISRGGLNLALINAAAREPNVEFHFRHPCIDVDLGGGEARFMDEASGSERRIEADLIAGADGAFSPVRLAMQKTDRFEYSQSYLEHGYKELHIPAIEGDIGHGPGFAMEKHALHIWPRGGAMMIALPNPDATFTCTLFWPFTGEHGLDSLQTPEQVRTFFARHYPDAVPLMPTLTENYFRNPSSSLVTIRCAPWHRMAADGKRGTVLLGDACHAIVPFYGQGMNCAFEDCRVLAQSLARHGRDLASALPEYFQARKAHADAIADMAVENFVEMRDKVGSADFLYRKRLEHAIHELEPERLVPQYHLVSFTTVPYAEARAGGRRIDRIVDHLSERLPRREAEALSAAAWLPRVKELLPAAERAAESASRS